MRVIVTGGAGRLGRYVCASVARQHSVTVADRAATDEASSVVVDILDIDSLREAFNGAEAVIHLAGVDYDYHRRAEDTIRTNTLGTWNVLQACAELAVKRVVLCSSVAAMGLHEMRADWRPQALPVTESHPISPVEPYSVSKAVVETMGRSFVDGHQLDVVCLRPCTVVTASNIDELLGEHAQIFLGEYIAADDCGEAFAAALTAPSPGFGPYLIAADDTLSDQPTLEFLASSLGHLPRDIDEQWFANRPRASLFDNSAARRALQWSPRSTLADLRTVADRQSRPAGTAHPG